MRPIRLRLSMMMIGPPEQSIAGQRWGQKLRRTPTAARGDGRVHEGGKGIFGRGVAYAGGARSVVGRGQGGRHRGHGQIFYLLRVFFRPLLIHHRNCYQVGAMSIIPPRYASLLRPVLLRDPPHERGE